MCLMAHTQAKTSEIYTKRVERASLAATAISKLSALNFDKWTTTFKSWSTII